jgi:hypothetical protein
MFAHLSSSPTLLAVRAARPRKKNSAKDYEFEREENSLFSHEGDYGAECPRLAQMRSPARL